MNKGGRVVAWTADYVKKSTRIQGSCGYKVVSDHKEMKRQELNNKLINLSKKITELFHQNSDPNLNSLIGEYRTIEKYGNQSIKLSATYIKEYEEKHGIEFPNILNEILLEYGEHPLCHFFLEPDTKSKLLEPTYVIRIELFQKFISEGVNIYDIEEFKSDYNDYYNPLNDTFNLDQMNVIYQEFKLQGIASFDLIMNTCQQIQVILNTDHKGKLVSTNAGDRLIKINSKDYYQPYYLIMNETNDRTINDIHLEHIVKTIKRLEKKVENTVTNML